MPFPDYTSLPQYANILHLWKLDELSGTREDSKGSCDLTDWETVLYGTGKLSNAADFEFDDNDDLRATAELSADMNFTSSNFSVSFWMKAESDINEYVITRGLVNVDGWEILLAYSVHRLTAYLNTSGATTYWYSNDDIWALNTWVHITVVRNGTTGYIYKNGVDDTFTSTTLVNPASADRLFYLSRKNDGTNDYDGLLDEVIVWDVALSPAEVSTLYSWYSKVELSGAISFIGTLSISKLYKKLLEGGISFIGTLSRKVSYKRIQEGVISFIGTLQRKLSLHRLLEGSISFIGTLLGSRLYKKILEGAISFIGTLSRKRTYRKILEGTISFIGKLKTTKLWRAVSKMSNIWTPEDKRSNVWTPQDKRDNDWTEE